MAWLVRLPASGQARKEGRKEERGHGDSTIWLAGSLADPVAEAQEDGAERVLGMSSAWIGEEETSSCAPAALSAMVMAEVAINEGAPPRDLVPSLAT